jgi:hypothetical protein
MQHNDAPGCGLCRPACVDFGDRPSVTAASALPSRAFSPRTGLSGVPESCGGQGVDFADHAVDSADPTAQKDQ